MLGVPFVVTTTKRDSLIIANEVHNEEIAKYCIEIDELRRENGNLRESERRLTNAVAELTCAFIHRISA